MPEKVHGACTPPGVQLQLIGAWAAQAAASYPAQIISNSLKLHTVHRALPTLNLYMLTHNGHAYRLQPPCRTVFSHPPCPLADPTVCIHFNDSRISIVFSRSRARPPQRA